MRAWSAETLTGALEARGIRVVGCSATDFTLSFSSDLLKSTAKSALYRLGLRKRPHLTCVARTPEPQGPA